MLAAADVVVHPYFWGGWFVFPIFWFLFIFGLIFFLRRRRGGCYHHGWRSGESVLAERYARGEINEQEYRERQEVLRQNNR